MAGNAIENMLHMKKQYNCIKKLLIYGIYQQFFVMYK